ncbi:MULTISPECIES: diguanylate cyclase [unclassified Massilia]|uniref:diguanylate cyclase n=1 Tax=unclassified Massilia TaxID=2609279 RepID=UPI0015FFE8F0|nr:MULTISPECIES: diguanylate cyclase [unclassified Massilia]QNB00899.1 GGDEF domain-containing protein [Massilia sp. Se16.2.3]
MTDHQPARADDVRGHQKTRRHRMLIGSLSYLFTLSLVVAFWYRGDYGFDIVRNYVLAVSALVATFYLLIRSDINLRFADPSMTLAQVTTSILPAFYVMYHSQDSRPVCMMLCFSAAMYGLFQFRMRDFLVLSFVVSGGYAALIALIYFTRPGEIHLQLEILLWCALTATFLQFSGLGGYISSLRHKVKGHYKELATRNAELEQALLRIQELAMHDELTGVFNRRFLMETIRAEKLRADRTGEVFTVALLDVDHFKSVNDRFGHLAGDRVLQAIARTASGALRQTDYFGRYGGEEFALLLTSTDAASARVTAERVREAIAALSLADIAPGFRVTVSIGIAEACPDESNEMTFKRADDALYRAKEAGRNRCVLADEAAEDASVHG